MKGKALIGLGVVVVALLGGGAYLYSTLNDQTAASVSSVVEEFRKTKGPDAAAQPGLPKQGVYRYAVTGTEHIVRSPLDVTRTLPKEAVVLVRNVDGGYETETRYSEQHTEQAKYAMKPDGAYVVSAVTRLVVGPLTTVKDRAWQPNLLRFPSASNDQKTWGGDFTTGDMKLKITSTREPDATVNVGGTSVDAAVVKFVQDVTGEFTGSRTETYWYAKDSGLVLRYTIDSKLKGETDFDFTADQTLVSLEPEV